MSTTSAAPAKARTAAGALAEFCAGLHWAALPEPVRERTRELVLDLLGVALRGSREPSSRPAWRLAAETQPSGGASLIGAGGATTGAAWAALANRTSAHAIEMDD